MRRGAVVVALRLRLLLLLLLAVVSCAARGGKGNRRACADLPEEILEQRFGRLSVGVLSAFHHTLHTPQNLSCSSAGLLHSDKRSSIPVNLLSLSPWAYRLRHDPARYPRFIPEAYCLCKGCLTGPGGQESEAHRSVPVFVPTAVLRRSGSCTEGRRSYSESYESIPVGCTCIPALKTKKSTHRGNQTTRRAVQTPTRENSKQSHKLNPRGAV